MKNKFRYFHVTGFLLAVLLGGHAVVAAESVMEECASRKSLPHSGNEEWQPGVHYSVLAPPAEMSAGPEKIELTELFMYTAPFSAEFQPYLQNWVKTKPAYVEYVRKPSVVYPHARPQAQLFFAIQALQQEHLQPELFKWIQDPHRASTYSKHFPTYDTIPLDHQAALRNLNVEFAKAHGISERTFLEAYNSSEVSQKVFVAEFKTHSYHVRGTSTLVVNGRYSTSAGRVRAGRGIEVSDFHRLLKLVDYLIEIEVQRLCRQPSLVS